MAISQTPDAFIQFREECIWVRRCYNTYQELFDSGQDTSKILFEIAGNFFYDLSVVMADYCIFHMCRLTDPPDFGKSENLTSQWLVRSLDDEGLLTDGIATYAKLLLEHRTRILTYRHKRLSHIDKATAMTEFCFDLGKEEDPIQFFENLQNFCDEVGNQVGVGPLDFRAIVGAGDVIDFIGFLKKGKRQASHKNGEPIWQSSR